MKHSSDSRPDIIQATFSRHLRQGMTRKAALHLTIKQLVTAGELDYLAKLPPSRVLAARLVVSRDTVELTYAQLEAEGYIARAVGRGSFVSYQQNTLIGRELLTDNSAESAQLAESELSVHGRSLLLAAHTPHTSRSDSLTPSVPDLRLFPIDSWLQLERQAVRQGAERLLGYADPQGLVETAGGDH
jgi:GntR family transcriptional regulator / MocR family aminotransferase